MQQKQIMRFNVKFTHSKVSTSMNKAVAAATLMYSAK